MVSDTALKAIILVGLLIFGGGAVHGWLKRHDAARDAKATAAQNDRTGKAAVAIDDKAVAAQQDAEALDVAVATQRVEIVHKYETLKNENKTVGDYTRVPVPRELRNLARERRIAIERLIGAQGGRPLDDGTEGTKE